MNTTVKIIKWAPRILCIVAILFVGMFSLDSFDPKLTLGQQLLGFLMHNIPTLCLVLLLIIAWRWELIGGVVFLLLSIGISPWLFTGNYRMNHSVWMSLSVILMITFPFMVAGTLFILSHYFKAKEAKVTEQAN